MTQRDAILEVLDRVGDQTKPAELQKRAAKILGYEPSYQSVIQARTAWRKEKGIVRDNRTYNGQPRRNMYNDKKVSRTTLNEFIDWNDGSDPDEALKVLNKFHSLEQVKNVYKMLKLELELTGENLVAVA